MENICKNYLFLTGDRQSVLDAVLTEMLDFRKNRIAVVDPHTWGTVITSQGGHIGKKLQGLSTKLPGVQFTLFYAIKLLRISGMAIYQAGRAEVSEKKLDFPMSDMNKPLSLEIFSGFTTSHIF